MNGTPNVAAMYAARPGLDIVSKIGERAIREKSTRLTSRILQLADQRGWRVNAPRDAARRGGTVAVDMPYSQEVCAELLKRDILVDWRPKAGVRMSPHFYNQEEEIDAAFAAVEEILAGMPAAVAR